MKTIELPSANFDSREGQAVDMLVLHYTGMKTAKDALIRLCDPEAKVSAHYVVDEDGTVYRVVPEDQRAWHAGVSSWRGNSNINARSIGIEIVNPGHEFGYRAFPDVQMKAVTALCKGILSRHKIPARNVVGHSDVAPDRKEDPGELFDWKGLAERGIGIWPQKDGFGDSGLGIREIQKKLQEFGYAIEPKDSWDEQAKKVVTAFQRRFRPSDIRGEWDTECSGLLMLLLQP